MRERFVAVLCAVAVLVASSPVRAESTEPASSSGEFSTAQKGVVYGLFGAAAVAFGASLVFGVKANGAESDRVSAIQALGGPSDGRCLTSAQCDAARPFREDQKSAADNVVLTLGIGGGLAAAGAVAAVVFYATRDKTSARLTPSFTGTAGGLNLEARF